MDEQSLPVDQQSQMTEQSDDQYAAQNQQQFSYGPRKMSFFTVVLKTFAGLVGGIAGTLVLLLIFLSTSSILQPVLGTTVENEFASGEVSPLFMVILMSMIFATSLISSMLSTFLLAYTERDRYTRIATTMSQVFIINIVIFAFVLPIYLTTSTTRLELTAFAAILQIILSAASSSLILELIHDYRYSLLAVYTTVLGVLVATGITFMLYITSGNTTVVLFAALPTLWFFIGLSQGVLAMIYYWIYQTWGSDFLANSTNFGQDYGIPDQTEEEEQIVHPDVEGGTFLKG